MQDSTHMEILMSTSDSLVSEIKKNPSHSYSFAIKVQIRSFTHAWTWWAEVLL